MAAKINLQELFKKENHLLPDGKFYAGINNEFGLWVELSVGDEKAYFVWTKSGVCMKHPIKLIKASEEYLMNTQQFTGTHNNVDIHFHKIVLYPNAYVHLSVKNNQLPYFPIYYEYISENASVEEEDEEPEQIETLQDADEDQRALILHIENFLTTSYISPDKKMAVISKNLEYGLVLIRSTGGKIRTYDFVSCGDCSKKEDKIPHIYPWICGDDVLRFSRPVFEGNNAILYCKRFQSSANDPPYYTKFTLELLPEF